MQAPITELPGRGSKIACAITLFIGCSPILLDQVVPPWGIPAALIAISLILKKQGQSLAVVGVVTPHHGWRKTISMYRQSVGSLCQAPPLLPRALAPDLAPAKTGREHRQYAHAEGHLAGGHSRQSNQQDLRQEVKLIASKKCISGAILK